MTDSSKRLFDWFVCFPAGRALAVACIVALVLCQQLMTLDGHGVRGVDDALHIPLFAALALLFMRALGYPPWPLLLAVCAAVAVTTEVLQFFTGRDASVMDVARDLVGAVPTIGFIEATRYLVPRRGTRSLIGLWLGALVLLGSLTLAGPVRLLLADKPADNHVRWRSYIELQRLGG